MKFYLISLLAQLLYLTEPRSVWIAAHVNIIIVTSRFVKLNLFRHVGLCCTTFTRRCDFGFDPSAEYCITLCSNFFQGWQNQNTWEIINAGTAALARYNNYAALYRCIFITVAPITVFLTERSSVFCVNSTV